MASVPAQRSVGHRRGGFVVSEVAAIGTRTTTEPVSLRVRVDPAAARDVAAAYSETPATTTPLAVAAYAQLVTESDRLFAHLTAPERPDRVRIAFTTCPAPYASAHELIRSVRHDRLLEVTTVAATPDRHHPVMGNEIGGAYDRFRGVHDVLGHARLGLGFDRDGEFAVWRSQTRWHGPLARWALATELHAHHSVLWTTGELARPKAILLDPRLLCRSVTAALRRPRPTAPTKGSP